MRRVACRQVTRRVLSSCPGRPYLRTPTHIAIVAIEHISDTTEYPKVSLGDRHELDRLLNGLNLLTAHLAQGFGRLRHRIGSGALTDLGDPDVVADITECLARAGTACELSAARLNDAHTTLTGTSTTPPGK